MSHTFAEYLSYDRPIVNLLPSDTASTVTIADVTPDNI